MRWWPRRQEPERIELHPGVPPLAEWSEHGLVGTIGSGPGAGCTVLAVLYRDEDGTFSAYALDQWDGPTPVLDAAGRFVMDDGVVDGREPGVEGGLIDALTREVDVVWWTDRARIAAFWAQHRF